MGGDRCIGADVPYCDCRDMAVQDRGGGGGTQSRSDRVSGFGSAVVDELQGAWTCEFGRFSERGSHIVPSIHRGLHEGVAGDVGVHDRVARFATHVCGDRVDAGDGLVVRSDRTQASDIRCDGIDGGVGFPVASD